MEDSETDPYPHGVTTPEQRRRWDASAAAAAHLGGQDGDEAFVQEATRSLYRSDIPTGEPVPSDG